MRSWAEFWNKPVGRWLVWALFVAAWTAGLAFPMPQTEDWPISPGQQVVIAKSGHVAGYAALAVLSGRLPLAAPARLVVLFFLMAHAGVTEWIQLRVSNRTGTLDDVLLDHLGILAGLILSWPAWRRNGS
jgi:VanZ family protein